MFRPTNARKGNQADIICTGEVIGVEFVTADQGLTVRADVELIAGAGSGLIEQLPRFCEQQLQRTGSSTFSVLKALGSAKAELPDFLLLQINQVEAGVGEQGPVEVAVLPLEKKLLGC